MLAKTQDDSTMIADLHCDLLLYLAQNAERSPFHSVVRCSIPQMQAGGVKLQVLPIFTETKPDSVKIGSAQNNAFHALPLQYPSVFFTPQRSLDLSIHAGSIGILRSIENASSFCEEDEPLDAGLQRLQHWLAQGKIAYISLTWNSENRFGGGCHTSQGIKDDGKRLLDFMNGKGVAVDLSHTSDRLAYDILDHIDKYSLQLSVLASHSNCRSIMNVARNLPDPLIHEVFKRQGIIGLNFIKPFLGAEGPPCFVRHLEHLIELGGAHHVCFGADFFFEEDIPLAIRRAPGEYFFEGFEDSSAYPAVINLWRKALEIPQSLLEKISYGTAARFLFPA